MTKKTNKIQDYIITLGESDTVEEAAEKLGISSKHLRRVFLEAGILSPASYLKYKEQELSKSDKQKIVQWYSNFGGSKTSDEIAIEIKKPKEKVKEFIKSEGLTHNSLPFTKNDQKMVDTEKIEKALEVHSYKLKAKLEAIEQERIKQDAYKWQYWKETVGDKLFKDLENFISNYQVPRFELETKREYAAVLAIQDFHFGRWSSDIEVKNATGIQKQQNDLFKCVIDLLEKVAMFGAPEILYMTIAGDWLNSDNFKLTTTKGTEQDSVPSHTFMMYNGGLLLVQLIDMLRQVFPKIELVITPGNHDRDPSISLYMFVSAWYRNVEGVKSIYSDLNSFKDLEGRHLRARQYRTYGTNLLCFTHGDGAKNQNMPIVIANEMRENWGKTKHTFLITGHLHYRISQDLFGVQHIQVPSLAGDDRYHDLKGYQGERGMTMILIDKEKGYMAELFSNLEQ
jgi:AraC-like DNA-binding protein